MKKLSFLCVVSTAFVGIGKLCAQEASPVTGYVEAFRPSAGDSVAARQARTAARLSQRLVNGEAQLLRSFAGLYQDVWHNADGLTPQQVCDALGPKAGNLFVIAGTMANSLYGIDPAGLGRMVAMPPGYAATIHADGTVTLAFTAPTPTPAP